MRVQNLSKKKKIATPSSQRKNNKNKNKNKIKKKPTSPKRMCDNNNKKEIAENFNGMVPFLFVVHDVMLNS